MYLHSWINKTNKCSVGYGNAPPAPRPPIWPLLHIHLLTAGTALSILGNGQLHTPATTVTSNESSGNESTIAFCSTEVLTVILFAFCRSACGWVCVACQYYRAKIRSGARWLQWLVTWWYDFRFFFCRRLPPPPSTETVSDGFTEPNEVWGRHSKSEFESSTRWSLSDVEQMSGKMLIFDFLSGFDWNIIHCLHCFLSSLSIILF